MSKQFKCTTDTSGGFFTGNYTLGDTYQESTGREPLNPIDNVCLIDNSGLDMVVERKYFTEVEVQKERKFKCLTEKHDSMTYGTTLVFFGVGDDGTNLKEYAPIDEQRWIKSRYLYDHDVEEIFETDELPVTPSGLTNEKAHNLKLVQAVFTDIKGRTVKVKRSPCRHYFIKVEGEKQKRVRLADALRVSVCAF